MKHLILLFTLVLLTNSYSQVQWSYVRQVPESFQSGDGFHPGKPSLFIINPSASVYSTNVYTYHGFSESWTVEYNFYFSWDYLQSYHKIQSGGGTWGGNPINHKSGKTHFLNSTEGIIQAHNDYTGDIFLTTSGPNTWEDTISVNPQGPGSGASLYNYSRGSVLYYDSNTVYSTSGLRYSVTESHLFKNDSSIYFSSQYDFSDLSYQDTDAKSKIHVVDDSLIYIVCTNADTVNNGRNGILLKSTDGGSSFTEKLNLAGLALREMSFKNDSTVFVVGDSGTLQYSTDGANTWTAVTTNVNVNLESIEVATDGYGYAVGDAGTILRTVDGGVTWNQVNAPDFNDYVYTRTFPGDFAYIYNEYGFVHTNQGDILAAQYKDDVELVKIYPNPAHDELHIELSEDKRINSIELIDLSGRVVLSRNSIDTNKLTVNLYYPAGVYMARVWTGDTFFTERVTIE